MIVPDACPSIARQSLLSRECVVYHPSAFHYASILLLFFRGYTCQVKNFILWRDSYFPLSQVATRNFTRVCKRLRYLRQATIWTRGPAMIPRHRINLRLSISLSDASRNHWIIGAYTTFVGHYCPAILLSSGQGQRADHEDKNDENFKSGPIPLLFPHPTHKNMSIIPSLWGIMPKLWSVFPVSSRV